MQHCLHVFSKDPNLNCLSSEHELHKRVLEEKPASLQELEFNDSPYVTHILTKKKQVELNWLFKVGDRGPLSDTYRQNDVVTNGHEEATFVGQHFDPLLSDLVRFFRYKPALFSEINEQFSKKQSNLTFLIVQNIDTGSVSSQQCPSSGISDTGSEIWRETGFFSLTPTIVSPH